MVSMPPKMISETIARSSMSDSRPPAFVGLHEAGDDVVSGVRPPLCDQLVRHGVEVGQGRLDPLQVLAGW